MHFFLGRVAAETIGFDDRKISAAVPIVRHAAINAVSRAVAYAVPGGRRRYQDRQRSRALDVLVPANTREAYDVRDVIEGLCDDRTVFEIKPGWAQNMVTAFARIEGRAVGFVANQPRFGAGAIDVSACEKAAHFIAVCDTFGLPVINLIDMPGFLVGPEAEATGLARRSGRLAYELSIATVPLIVITMRKAYGAAYVIMGGECGGSGIPQ